MLSIREPDSEEKHCGVSDFPVGEWPKKRFSISHAIQWKSLTRLSCGGLPPTGSQEFQPPKEVAGTLRQSLAILGSSESSSKEVARAMAEYHQALEQLLRALPRNSQNGAFLFALMKSGYYPGETFSEIIPVRSSRQITPGLHPRGWACQRSAESSGTT
jgi:hypothetical protein